MRKVGIVMILCLLSAIHSIGQHEEATFRKSYVNHTEFGGLLGRVTYGDVQQERTEQKASLTAQAFNGLQWSRSLALGIVAGMDWYKTALVTPIALGLRYQLGSGSNRRFFTLLDTGYGATWFHKDNAGFDTKGGWMINPGVGIRVGKASGFTMSISWKSQRIFAEKPILWNQLDRYEQRNYQRIALRIGLAF